MAIKIFKDGQTGEVIYLDNRIPDHKDKIMKLRRSEFWMEFFENA